MGSLLLGPVLAFTLAWVGPETTPSATEAIIRQPRVEVRSGPSQNYYATGELREGERVTVLRYEHDFAAIVPPPDSFSLIPVDDVQRISNSSGLVNVRVAEVLVGTPYRTLINRIAARLDRGAQVVILDRVEVQTQRGVKSYYKIKPTAREARYIPRAAFDANAATPVGGLIQPATFNAPIATSPELPPDVAEQLHTADSAYQKARFSGDWTQAERMYLELSGSLHHHARMTALNRLEFIRQRKGLPAEQPPSEPVRRNNVSAAYLAPGPWSPEGTNPRTRLPGAPVAMTGGPGVPLVRESTAGPVGGEMPGPTPPSQPSSAVPARTTSGGAAFEPVGTGPDRIPPQSLGSAPAAAVPARPAGPEPLRGTLRRAYQTHFSQPLYYVLDHQGMLKAYVTPGRGLNLEPLVNQIVEVQGGTPRLDPALGGKPHVTANGVKRFAP